MTESPGELLRQAYTAALRALPEDYIGTRAARMHAVEAGLRSRGFDLDDALRELLAPGSANGQAPAPSKLVLRIVTLQEFAAVKEPGTESLLGAPGDALIPTNGDVMIFGAGGAAKTTLEVDLAMHLVAGDAWLGIPVGAPLKVLCVELEGPRPMFRGKIDDKIAAWTGSPIGDRARVLEEPWADLSLAVQEHRQVLAEAIRALEIDVVFLGPVTAGGMDDAGTLTEVRDFMALVADVRARAGRLVSFVLIHHESKSGKVSGAWEGAVDTLLHVSGMGPGRTRLYVAKARWASTHHAKTLELRWTEGQGFEVDERPEMDDDAIAEKILVFVGENPATGWSRVEEATPGMSRDRRRAVRDGLLRSRKIVNIVRVEGAEMALDHCPERKAARLYVADDPTIAHLRPDPGAVAAQTAPLWGEGGQAHLRRAPRPIRGAGVGAPDSPHDPEEVRP